MTDCQLETASKNLCASLDPADKTAELERCESQINQLIERLARDGPERLEAERQIGDVLLHVKKIDPKNLVKWTDQTFGRGREWRCTHMALARRSDHLPQARAWAVSEGLKLAAYYSVDGALELLKAWDLATGQASQKPKRSLPKKARTSDKGGFILQQSPEQAEIAVLRQRLREQSDEAAYFRIELPLDIRSEARALLVRASARDDKAERELRAIARQHRWLFRDLCDALGPEKSGAPDFPAPHSPLETPLGDEGSPSIAISEASVDASKVEETTSQEASGKQSDLDSSPVSAALAAALDNYDSSPRLDQESPQNDENLHGAHLEKAAPPMPGRSQTKTVVVETLKSRRKNAFARRGLMEAKF